jgi:hypothetical protein
MFNGHDFSKININVRSESEFAIQCTIRYLDEMFVDSCFPYMMIDKDCIKMGTCFSISRICRCIECIVLNGNFSVSITTLGIVHCITFLFIGCCNCRMIMGSNTFHCTDASQTK